MEIMSHSSQNSDTIQRYKDLYDKDPTSKIFAPLAEAYRKSGQTQLALKVAKKGIENHPNFASGLVTYSRILIDLEKYKDAIPHLKEATEMSPDNFLAHKLLGETYIKLKDLTRALQVFKMALYLDPLDEFAKKMVKKLESLSAADFEKDVFDDSAKQVAGVQSSVPRQQPKFNDSNYEMDRFLSLVDAYIARSDYKKASETLNEAIDKIGKTPELQRRQIFITKRFEDSSQKLSEIDTIATQQIKKLNELLSRIEDRKIY